MGQPNAAILFEPDGYLISGHRLVGRQMAGNAFLRAVATALEDEMPYVHTPRGHSAETFWQTHCRVQFSRIRHMVTTRSGPLPPNRALPNGRHQ
jgi:hypothetical protein